MVYQHYKAGYLDEVQQRHTGSGGSIVLTRSMIELREMSFSENGLRGIDANRVN